MQAEAPTPRPASAVGGFLWSKWLTVALLAYWAAFALAAPAMNWDSQTYNLARLYIARYGGLFGNRGWNTDRQVMFPWTFDAVHYPFLWLHWGYCLPSFACLVGLCVVVYRAVAAHRPARQGWWCCLALLAMPTLVFQGVCTKNDMPVAFGLACWYHAWRLWRGQPRRSYVVFMALALAFTAGAKTTGLLFFGGLGAFTLWQVRADRAAAGRFVVWMAVFFALLGSVEIYLNNLRVYHAPLGPPEVIRQNQNRDGLAGGAANFIRYCFGNMNAGVDAFNFASPTAARLEDACRAFLRFAGLDGNLGLRQGLGETDANLHFYKSGYDSATDFGPVGALSLAAGLIFVLSRPRTDPLWWLAAAGVASLALISHTVAWMAWNGRFLLVPFSLFAVALTLWVLRRDESGGTGRFLSSAYFCLLVYSAVGYALHSRSKKPADLVPMLTQRTLYETNERAAMLEILRDLRARAPQLRPATVFLHAGSDSWVFCFFELGLPRLVPAPTLDPQALAAAGAAGSVYVLAINSPVDAAILPDLVPVKGYAGEERSALFQWRKTPPSP